MSGEELIYGVLGFGLVAYALTGGADFGGGVWTLLATGPRREDQRAAVRRAIAPIWEANHVWLIFMIVLMFTVFPKAFASIGVALHVPLALALVGIVLRGAAFSFRAYGLQDTGAQQRWERVFAWTSLATPLLLGMTLAGTSSGEIRIGPSGVSSGFFAGWTTPFAFLVGLFTLVLFALLAALYLTVETDGALREDFRRRALASEILAGILAAVTAGSSAAWSPEFFANLLKSPWSLPVQVATAASALATIGALMARRFRLARVTAAAQVALVVIGWGLAMDHHLVLPDLPISAAGVEPAVVAALLPALGIGTVILAPSLWYLFRVFKGRDGGGRGP